MTAKSALRAIIRKQRNSVVAAGIVWAASALLLRASPSDDSVQITIFAPSGGESWEATTVQYVRWTAQNVNALLLSYSADSGLTWNASATIRIDEPGWGDYPWEVPNESSHACIVRLSGYEGEYPQNSAAFSITPTLQHRIYVTKPIATAYESGTEIRIQWLTVNVSAVRLEFSADSGKTFAPIEYSAVSVSDSQWQDFAWTIPDISSQHCMIRIREDGDTAAGYSSEFRIISGNSLLHTGQLSTADQPAALFKTTIHTMGTMPAGAARLFRCNGACVRMPGPVSRQRFLIGHGVYCADRRGSLLIRISQP